MSFFQMDASYILEFRWICFVIYYIKKYKVLLII